MRSLFCQYKLTKGVQVATCLWGIGTAGSKENMSILKNKVQDVELQYKELFLECKSAVLCHCNEVIAEVGSQPIFNPLLIVTAACEGSQSDKHTEPIVLNVPVPNSSDKTGIDTKSSDGNEIKSSKNDSLTVVLHDSHKTDESMIVRYSHIVLSWSIFASVWSSVVLFPVVTIWNFMSGAWATVASIGGVWTCSLLVRFPTSHEIRRFLFRGLHKWFPQVEIVYEEEPPTEKTIFCCHPHGVFCMGTAMLLDDLNYRQLPDGSTREVAIVAAPFLRWCNPIFKFVTDVVGIHIHGAGRGEFKKLLDTGKSCTLVPGGFSEATITCVGKERIYINKRKGFIKYALRAGYSLTPVYVFGESDLYHNPQGLWDLRLYLNSLPFQIPAVLPFGYPIAPLAPRRIPLRIVCAAPLQLPLIKEPTEADVDFYHTKYVTAVQELFYRHVNDYHAHVYSKHIDNTDNSRVLERW